MSDRDADVRSPAVSNPLMPAEPLDVEVSALEPVDDYRSHEGVGAVRVPRHRRGRALEELVERNVRVDVRERFVLGHDLPRMC